MGCGIVSARGAGTELSEIRGMVDFSFLSTVHHSTMIWENICICDQIKKLVSRSHFSFLSVSDLRAYIGKNIANKLISFSSSSNFRKIYRKCVTIAFRISD